MNSDATVTFVSCPPEHAEALARKLVEAGVAACVNVIPGVHSVYRWKGDVSTDNEALLVIKSAAQRIEDLKATVLKHHPYELPEFITVNVAQGHGPYLQWILDSTK